MINTIKAFWQAFKYALNVFVQHEKSLNELAALGIKPNMRVALNEKHFETLITGGVVYENGAAIILSDIGYKTMEDILNKAIAKYDAEREFGYDPDITTN